VFRRHRADDSINKAITKLIRSDLILIDDVGLLPVSPDAADALFRVVDAAYEKRSIAISSNIHPAGFDELMPKTMATATVDRLLHHAHVIITDGQDSYRLLVVHPASSLSYAACDKDFLGSPAKSSPTSSARMEVVMAIKGIGRRIEVSDEDRAELERIVRASSAEVRMVERARIVLAAAEGMTGKEIAGLVGCSLPTVVKWRGRYASEGMQGLRDATRSGAPLTHGPETRALLIAKAYTRPAATEEGARRERWTYEELGREVGMSSSQAHLILSRAAIRPHLTDYWIMSDFSREGFEERMGEVCGLYVDPPENVLVVSIDEKTGIQAKSPIKPDIPPAPGKPARREAEYDRNGTQCLFACLNVHEGDVLAMPSKTRNRFDRIRFLDMLEEEIPIVEGQEIVAVSDNLSTRGTAEVQQWLTDHPRWRFQFTPTHASWLNQVEIFFSILWRRLLKNGIFTSEQDLATQMLAFVETYNQTAKPFKWTYTGKVLEA